MAVASGDKFVIDRAGVHFQVDADDINTFVGGVTVVDNLLSTSGTDALSAGQGKVLNDKIDALGTVEHSAADITARDALAGLVAGDRVYVTDASADGTVTAGWAIYRWDGAAFLKMAEQESLDVNVVANLAYTAAPTNGTVTSDVGTDATLPLADATNAGLLAPAEKTKVGFITVTQAVDLDAMETASHDAVTLTGAATTNPLTLTGQVLGFSISQLAVAP